MDLDIFLKKTRSHDVSLALRLATMLTLATGACLALTFMTVYFVMERGMLARLDDKLRHEKDEIALLASISGLDSLQAGLSQIASAEGTGNVFLRVLDPESNVYMESDSTNWKGLAVRPDAVGKALRGEGVYDTVWLNARQEARVLYIRLSGNRVLQAALSVAHETGPIRSLARILLIGAVAALYAVMLVSWFVTLHALHPLKTMTDISLQIAGGNLNERMPSDTPSRELKRLSAAFNTMLDRIQSFIRELREMNEGLAHDSRTMLARIRLAAQRLLESRPLNEEQEALSIAVLESSDELLGMLNTVMDLSEMNTGLTRTKCTEVDLHHLSADLIDFFEDAAREKHIKLEMSGTGPAMVHGEQDKLRRALANLLDNAIKFTGPGGRIRLHLSTSAEEVTVTVSDTGVGIPEQDQARVFERFYRTNASRSGPGHGLGLSLVEAIVKLHGGTVHLQSTLGEGSVFTLRLPCVASAAPRQ